MTRVLIFEPDTQLAERFEQLADGLGLRTVTVSDSETAKALLAKQFFHLCLWPVADAVDAGILTELKHLRPSTAFLVISASADTALVVECVRQGASNVWVRQEDLESLSTAISETLARILPESPQSDMEFPFPQFVGRHPAVLEVFELILSLKNSDSNVLITGESGTGKEVVARAIHNLSGRKRSNWMAVNCGAIPANLLESELFGHVKGAFTGATQNRIGRFQLAGQGTLFLDEISDLPLDLQAKILRAIQQRVFEPVGSPQSIRLEARIIAASNQDLETAIAEKRFREDLFYRLNVIPIHMPPLRARKSDIPLLVKSFLDTFNEQNMKQIPGITEEAMRCLLQYNWPGNVRELENLIERVVVLKRNNAPIEVRDFPVDYFKRVRLDRFVANVDLPEEGINFNDAVNDFENELILQALQRTSGNRNRAATLLGLNRTTLVEKLKRKGLRLG